MKITMEFNLPEDKDDYDLHNNASNMFCILVELDSFLRSKLKYEELNNDQYTSFEIARNHLYALLDDKGVKLY